MNIARCGVVLGSMMLVLGAAAPASAQHPGSNAEDLPPNVREQLWPTQHLSPAKAQLRQRMMVTRDSLTKVEADVALIRRQRRGSKAMLASSARILARDCETVGRTAKWMGEYARSLSTSDSRWGPLAIQTYREAITNLDRGMASCAAAAAREVKPSDVDPDRLMATAEAAHAVITTYRTAEQGLLNTLQIKIDPRERPSPDSL